jgi:SGNH hydrolase-like domain, acetyltransferase AlgX
MAKRVLGRLTLIFFGIATVVGAIELAPRLLPLRVLPSPLPQIIEEMRVLTDTFYRLDPYFRFITAPRADFAVSHPEFVYRVKMKLNFPDAGFRGGTLGGPLWGVAVGDSFTFGMGVEHEQTWVTRLAQLIGCDIANLGVPGWGPQQYSRVLEKYGLGLHPRITFYGFFRNDFQDAIEFDHWLHDRSAKYWAKSFLQKYSVTFNLIRMISAGLRSGPEDIILNDVKNNFSATKLTRSLQEDRVSFQSAWPLVAEAIEQAIHETQRAQATFVLVYLTAKEEAYWELIKAKQSSLAGFDDAIDLGRKRILEFCDKRKILCVDLTPALRTRASQGQRLYFARDNHWTEAGNLAVAQEIYQTLLANKLVPANRCVQESDPTATK